MSLTVGALAREVGLAVRVDAGLDRPIAWVHSTELADPTPFLEGGELLLTTGIALGPPDDYVRRLVAAGAVGLGFGTGLSHDRVPADLVDAARAAGLALLEVPRATPFIAITKAVAADKYAAISRADRARQALTRSAVGDGPRGVVERLAGLVGGGVALLDGAGAPVHACGDLPDLTEQVRRLAASAGAASASWQAGERHAAMQVLGRRGFLAVVAPGPLDAGVVNTAASLLTLALARSDEVERVRRDLRAERFRLLLAGVPVAGLPEAPFRVFLPLAEVAEPPGFAAEVDGRQVVLAHDLDVPAAASSPVDATDVARGYREALRALEEGVARFEEVASARLLAPDAAEHAAALLAPLDDVLRETLRAWLACHGQADPAAARLGVHRHTVRNRLRRVELLLGRSLEPAGTRAELWFALHAGN
ncbi:PucR family transcriptional regulator [Saccharothrix syringae]|uniref:PucR family transcriptional regulator n=1 Tax=Saccharothrix syringae TaxID=103733 RepID=A0A5Q0H6X5_SACSY|nr:PucR family transcriptional regulator [Saccharothrix syringae]QFZ21961.1 PucR family transcriptional regulator [Saccharothrix syringae]